jgi:nitronate monooxygenase
MAGSREPIIIQGGMGVAVSSWPLARAVALASQLGVVSGTAIDVVVARRLQLGDVGGHIRRALAEFPYAEMARRILKRFFIPGGKKPEKPFRPASMPSLTPSAEQTELIVAANFVEAHLAGEGHKGLIGVNYLEKIQLPTLPSLYGAMLAGVDYVLIGAGIPRWIPGILDRFSRGQAAELPIQTTGADAAGSIVSHFDPRSFGEGPPLALKRPKFLAIVSSATLASMLSRKASGSVDGFVVEGPTAGGHNAPPRGEPKFTPHGEPVYGPRDEVNLVEMRGLGKPFWLAGAYGSADGVKQALDYGAAGVQVGTAFAFCNESGLRDDLKRRVLSMAQRGEADVLTDPKASPTGFPFKVLQLGGSMSHGDVYAQRRRVCDLGYLRQGYRKSDGDIGWRCPGEDQGDYVRKGGELADTVGRKCICNALLANVGLSQTRRDGARELPLVTCGDDVRNIAQFASGAEASSYSAGDVIEHLLSGVSTASFPQEKAVEHESATVH